MCSENYRAIPAGGSLCSCLGRFPGCQCMKPFLLFSCAFLCCSKNSKGSGPERHGFLRWCFEFHLFHGSNFRYSPKSFIVAILNNFLGYFKIDKHEIVYHLKLLREIKKYIFMKDRNLPSWYSIKSIPVWHADMFEVRNQFICFCTGEVQGYIGPQQFGWTGIVICWSNLTWW